MSLPRNAPDFDEKMLNFLVEKVANSYETYKMFFPGSATREKLVTANQNWTYLAAEFLTQFEATNSGTKEVEEVKHKIRIKFKNLKAVVKSLKQRDRKGLNSHCNLRNLDLANWEKLVQCIESEEAERLTTIDPVDNVGWTPLMCAASKGHKEICQILLSKGANPNHLSKDDQTAIMLAVSCGSIDVVNDLINYGAIVNQQDKFGKSSLHYAIKYNQTEMAEILLIQGADPNLPDLENMTPTLMACQMGNETTVALLLKYKGNPNLRNKQGLQGNSLALGHPKVLQLLKSVNGDKTTGDPNSSIPMAELLCQLNLEKYLPNFQSRHIDTVQQLSELLEKDLIDIGITAMGPKLKLLNAINQYKELGRINSQVHEELPSIQPSTSEACNDNGDKQANLNILMLAAGNTLPRYSNPLKMEHSFLLRGKFVPQNGAANECELRRGLKRPIEASPGHLTGSDANETETMPSAKHRSFKSDTVPLNDGSIKCVICGAQGNKVKLGNHFGCKNCCDSCRKFFERTILCQLQIPEVRQGTNESFTSYNKCCESRKMKNDSQNRSLVDYTADLRRIYESNLNILLSAEQEAHVTSNKTPAVNSCLSNNYGESSGTTHFPASDLSFNISPQIPQYYMGRFVPTISNPADDPNLPGPSNLVHNPQTQVGQIENEEVTVDNLCGKIHHGCKITFVEETLTKIHQDVFGSDYKAQLFSPSSPYPSDCVITLKDNKEVHAQKGILSLHSEYFKNIFANDITSTIALDTVDYDDFVNLLAIIYPTLHSITAENVEAILKLAHKLTMRGVLNRCEAFLMADGSRFGRAKLLSMAQLSLDRLLDQLDSCRTQANSHIGKAKSDAERVGKETEAKIDTLRKEDEELIQDGKAVIDLMAKVELKYREKLKGLKELEAAIFKRKIENEDRDDTSEYKQAKLDNFISILRNQACKELLDSVYKNGEKRSKQKNPTKNVNETGKRSISADPFNRLAIKHNTQELCKILNTFGIKMDTGYECDYANNPPDKRCECGRSLGLPDTDPATLKKILRDPMMDGPHHFANWMFLHGLHPDIFALENPKKVLSRKSICTAGRFYQSRDLKEYFEIESKKKDGKYMELEKNKLCSVDNYFIFCKLANQFYWQIYYGTDKLCVAGYGPYPDYDERKYFFNKEFHQ